VLVFSKLLLKKITCCLCVVAPDFDSINDANDTPPQHNGREVRRLLPFANPEDGFHLRRVFEAVKRMDGFNMAQSGRMCAAADLRGTRLHGAQAVEVAGAGIFHHESAEEPKPATKAARIRRTLAQAAQRT
jgi:hypothetical protein